MAHFGQEHLPGIHPVGSPGAADRRLELWFDTVPAAAAARHAAAEDQLVRLRALPGRGDVTVPVQLTAGRFHCQHSCIIMHGLPYEYCTEGLTQTLLDCAGCPSDTYIVRGEFLGDLPGHLTSGGPLVGSGKACLAYIQTPDDDRHLARLPKRFFIDGDTRINITRPGRMRQPSQQASSQAQLLQQQQPPAPPQPQPPRHSGPRPIRQRQRAALARARAAQPAQATPSPQLRQLEARVQASRAPGDARAGLGATAASGPPQPGARFLPARDTQPATPMDCTPPSGAEILPAVRQTLADMDIDAQPAPPRAPAATPMEWETPARTPLQQTTRRRVAPARDTAAASPMECDSSQLVLPGTSALTQETTAAQVPGQSAPPLELSGVPSTRIEDCLEWLAGHTDFSPSDSVAAIRQLYRDAPLALLTGDFQTARDQRHRMLCDTLRRMHGSDSLPEDAYGLPALMPAGLVPLERGSAAAGAAGTAADRQPGRPAVPPGFESRAAAASAARQAAQAALAGLAAPRRSGRARQQPTEWWLKQQQRQQRRPPEHRTHATEGLPARRPSPQ